MFIWQWRKRRARHSWLLDRSNPTLPAVVSVRGLQRVDVLASFGPPGTQHGTPEEEDEVGSTIMSKEEAARSEGWRRKMTAMGIARTSWRRNHSHNNGGHSCTEREGGGRGRRHHSQSIHKAKNEHKNNPDGLNTRFIQINNQPFSLIMVAFL